MFQRPCWNVLSVTTARMGVVLPALSIAAGLAVWELIGLSTPPVVFAPASAAFSFLVQQSLNWALPVAIAQSLITLFTGFFSRAAVALPLAFLMGRCAWLHEMLQPVITGIYAIPPVAFIPFFIIWFGLLAQPRLH